jgi:L-galactono-1,4-lactone dehydrogenase
MQHVKKVNEAEAEYWKTCEGSRVADSTDILGFDCGGQQLVLEVCFPIGSLQENSGKDITFVKELLQIIEQSKIPAASPIEQRYCSTLQYNTMT